MQFYPGDESRSNLSPKEKQQNAQHPRAPPQTTFLQQSVFSKALQCFSRHPSARHEAQLTFIACTTGS